MKTSKKIISLLLTAAMLIAMTVTGGVVVSAASDIGKASLNAAISMYSTYSPTLYSTDTWADYTAAYNAATSVYNNSSATSSQVQWALADLTMAENSLRKNTQTVVFSAVDSPLISRIAPGTSEYTATVYFTVPAGYTYSFADMSASLQAGFASLGSGVATYISSSAASKPALQSGRQLVGFNVTFSVAASAGTYVKIPFSWTVINPILGEKTYNSFIMFYVSAEGTQTTNKAALGHILQYELSACRQSWMYATGYDTYTSVLDSALAVFSNLTSTQTQIDRAVSNIELAIDDMTESTANYDGVYAAIADANSRDQSVYDNFNDVVSAISLVEYNLPQSQQEYVDQLAQGIVDALNALTLKIARYTVHCHDAAGNDLVAPSRITSKMTYVVSVTAPAIAGYVPSVESQTIRLEQTDIDVVFTYAPCDYVVTFYPQGGTVGVASKSVVYDAEYGELPVPVRPGYAFLGWYSLAAGGERVLAETIVTVNYFSKLYAHWSDIESYTLRFDSNGGSELEDSTKTYGVSVTLPTPTLYGYDFAGWYFDETLETAANFTVMPDLGDAGDIVMLYAKWTPKTYNVTLDANGGVNAGGNTFSVTYNAAYGELPTPSREGYSFTNWYAYFEAEDFDPLNPEYDYLPVTSSSTVAFESNHTLYAEWSINTYTLYFDMDGGTAIAPITQVYGTDITGINPTKEFYAFDGWTFNGQPFTLTTMPAGDITLKATWKLDVWATYYVDIYRNVDGQLIPTDSAMAGETVTVQVGLKTNYAAGAGRLSLMYDITFFDKLSGTFASNITFNSDSVYLSNIGTKNGSLVYPATSWSSFLDPSFPSANFNCIMTNYVVGTGKTPVAITEKEVIFSVNLTLKSTVTTGLSSAVYCEPLFQRTAENNSTKSPLYISNYYNATNDSVNLGGIFTDNSKTLTVTDVPFALLAKKTAAATTVIDNTGFVVSGIAPKLTPAAFASDYAKVVGTGTISCDDAFIGTGSIIRIVNAGATLKTYTALVYGDIDGNGKINGQDAFLIELYTNGMLTAADIGVLGMRAADADHDGNVDADDLTLVRNAGVSKASVSQVVA